MRFGVNEGVNFDAEETTSETQPRVPSVPSVPIVVSEVVQSASDVNKEFGVVFWNANFDRCGDCLASVISSVVNTEKIMRLV